MLMHLHKPVHLILHNRTVKLNIDIWHVNVNWAIQAIELQLSWCSRYYLVSLYLQTLTCCQEKLWVLVTLMIVHVTFSSAVTASSSLVLSSILFSKPGNWLLWLHLDTVATPSLLNAVPTVAVKRNVLLRQTSTLQNVWCHRWNLLWWSFPVDHKLSWIRTFLEISTTAHMYACGAFLTTAEQAHHHVTEDDIGRWQQTPCTIITHRIMKVLHLWTFHQNPHLI